MRGPLTVAVAQPVTIAHDIDHNVARHVDAIRSTDGRVVVFPEMSLTGYEFDAEPIDPADKRLAPLVDAATEAGVIVLAGAPVASRHGSKSIGILAIGGGAASTAYRKMYLGTAEQRVFAAGERPGVLEVDGWRLGLAVCKDTGVPEHAAATSALGIDVYAAGVLEHAFDREVQPTRARRVAADHAVWVAVASYAGSTGEGFDEAAGGSTIWRPDGTPAARAGIEPGEVAVAVVQ